MMVQFHGNKKDCFLITDLYEMLLYYLKKNK